MGLTVEHGCCPPGQVAVGSERTEREQLPQHSREMTGPLGRNTSLVRLERLDPGKGASLLDKDLSAPLLRTIEPSLCPLCAATVFSSDHEDQRPEGLSCKTQPE